MFIFQQNINCSLVHFLDEKLFVIFATFEKITEKVQKMPRSKRRSMPANLTTDLDLQDCYLCPTCQNLVKFENIETHAATDCLQNFGKVQTRNRRKNLTPEPKTTHKTNKTEDRKTKNTKNSKSSKKVQQSEFKNTSSLTSNTSYNQSKPELAPPKVEQTPNFNHPFSTSISVIKHYCPMESDDSKSSLASIKIERVHSFNLENEKYLKVEMSQPTLDASSQNLGSKISSTRIEHESSDNDSGIGSRIFIKGRYRHKK